MKKQHKMYLIGLIRDRNPKAKRYFAIQVDGDWHFGYPEFIDTNNQLHKAENNVLSNEVVEIIFNRQKS